MNINGARNFRHRKSPYSGSDLFLGHFTFSTSSSDDHSGDELTESDLFWSGENGITDSDESTRYPYSSHSHPSLGFRRREKSGILAALPDHDCVNGFKTPLRAIPKVPQRVSGELIQSSPCQKFQHSAPVNVPSTIMTRKKPKKFGQLEERESRYGDGDGDDEETLPPHEIVAMKLKSTSSVLEGVGRTLKGRDLRQVRNAVWRQTGFLD